ncbi:hypothetical protein [Rosenbergiella epipactidis]|uniref:hypothetical protein n=1 Tax=Rosenbergiella epipactidis TaxID=1544694 RepID=UPI001F4F78CC|nr:hypothetical protein [Rosenbergiella epipactidis]
MDISTNHNPSRGGGDYGIRIYEDSEDESGSNNAEISIYLESFIDSRTELDLEIKKRAIEFLRRAAAEIEADLNKS